MSDILLNAEEKMMGVIDNLESNLRHIRTGRASGQMLERVQVEYYGAMTPINQMAQISVVEGTQLVIKPYDRSIIKDQSCHKRKNDDSGYKTSKVSSKSDFKE